MYHVYLLKSKKKEIFYIGYTNNIEQRLKQHNSGQSEYTKKYMPWDVIYYESFVSLEDAKVREKSLKFFGRTYNHLKLRIKNSLDKVKDLNRREGAG